MHGVSVVALNIYDMLKPIDKGVEILNIRLVSKTGGKSDRYKVKAILNSAVIVCSDSISKGTNADRAGKEVIKKLEKWNLSVNDYRVIPDEINQIQEQLKRQIEEKTSLIVFVGGTGLSPRDSTPEAISPLIQKRINGDLFQMGLDGWSQMDTDTSGEASIEKL